MVLMALMLRNSFGPRNLSVSGAMQPSSSSSSSSLIEIPQIEDEEEKEDDEDNLHKLLLFLPIADRVASRTAGGMINAYA